MRVSRLSPGAVRTVLPVLPLLLLALGAAAEGQAEVHSLAASINRLVDALQGEHC